MNTNYSDMKIDKGLKSVFEKEFAEVRNRFIRVGETFINEGREGGEYNDVTGNLRSSVGYAIGFDGSEDAHSGPAVKGGSEGKRKADSVGQSILSEENPNDLVMVGYAGMEYGVDVESRGKDVITKSTKRAIRRLKAIMNKR